MRNSHCSLIANRLLEGKDINCEWLHKNYIRNQHKRLAEIQMTILARMPVWLIKVYHDTPFWPIINIGSQDGHPVHRGGKTTHCGRYILLKGYKQYLKRAIAEKRW